ncbi:peptidoglycan DD-metalloendopeptidase family protein [Methylomarinum sp. Ch1-1]|uniref:Peptidoglycan DD-metalloendopeptidase family protein n=1 Tax=Methylomarinum roseum TaxID=3067653 RepID=A0AAU7NVS1_9GAMM|nr:M23 family metallopeptidase [Methylomarinum sp. Ch1-1]MDP4519184.1 peptidoglycan DD-metalloendopeptidase family protein [Methylomarinum sp. Ch1-1]
MIKKTLCLLLLPIAAWAAKLPEQLAVPGGIVKIAVGKRIDKAPKVFYHDNRVLVTQDGEDWLAMVGIPLSADPGQHRITVVHDNHKDAKTFNVANKDYPAQRLTITKKRMVTGFTEEDLKRINADKIAMTKAKAVWSERPIAADFIAPVDGRLSSLFGLKRFFNDIPKRPHNGLDIAAPTGTPILAPAAGKVIDTGNYYFNGNTVFLDHGQGLLSAYLHMNEIKVKPGDWVEQGDELGSVGETGRVTGPHLHWIVYLNKATVDPALFISQDIARLDARNKK